MIEQALQVVQFLGGRRTQEALVLKSQPTKITDDATAALAHEVGAETEQEAEGNIREALAAAIESYREGREEIPWQREPAPRQSGEISRWIVVHV